MTKSFCFVGMLALSLSVLSCSAYNVYQTSRIATTAIKGFSSSEDVKLGKKLSEQIESDYVKYPILSEKDNPDLYAYIRSMVDTILMSDEIQHKTKFPWQVKIINKNISNAFALPGGYFYVYKGLIEYLDSEDQLIGVLAHEIAHTDRRHSVRQLRKTLGLQVLLQATTGNAALIQSLSGQIISLKITRGYEQEADEYAVKYLCNSTYNAKGVAGFFEKITSSSKNQDRQAQFLSTHPSPENRVHDITALYGELNCQGDSTYVDRYNYYKSKSVITR